MKRKKFIKTCAVGGSALSVGLLTEGNNEHAGKYSEFKECVIELCDSNKIYQSMIDLWVKDDIVAVPLGLTTVRSKKSGKIYCFTAEKISAGLLKGDIYRVRIVA